MSQRKILSKYPRYFNFRPKTFLDTSGTRNSLRFFHSRYLADTYPEKFFWLRYFSDEIYLFFDAVVSVTYLKVYQGLLTEHFYGLTRQNSVTISTSIGVHTVLPYLLKKLETDRGQDQVILRTLNISLQTIFNSLNFILTLLYSSGFNK